MIGVSKYCPGFGAFIALVIFSGTATTCLSISKKQAMAAAETSQEQKNLQKKIDSLIVDKMKFADTTVQSIVNWIRMRSKELDAKGGGISILLKINPLNTESIPLVTMDFENISMGEIIRYVCLNCKLKYKIEDYVVIITDDDPGKDKPVATAANKDLQKKLSTLIIDNLVFEDLPVSGCFNLIVAKSRELDPEKTGVNIFMNVSKQSMEKPLTMDVSKIPVESLIKNICQATGLEYRIEKYAIMIFDKEPPKKSTDTQKEDSKQ